MLKNVKSANNCWQFNMLINVKMPTINIYEQDKFRAQLSMKKVLKPWGLVFLGAHLNLHAQMFSETRGLILLV